MNFQKYIVVCLAYLVSAAIAPSAFAQGTGEALALKRPSELRESPSDTSRSLASLPAQTALVRLALRQGPWLQVKTTSGDTGWVHMFDIGNVPVASQTSNAATGALRGLSNFFNRGSASGGGSAAATSTIGIRGLGAEDLATAQPNPPAVAKMEGLRIDAVQANRFAASVAWTARPVAALPEPAAAANAVTPAIKESF
jgi:hypothetical protein